jgi:malonyl-CoA decarboxylase
MLVHLLSPNFSIKYLNYLDQDPVHSFSDDRTIDRRCQKDRNIFFWVEDAVVTAVLCVAYALGLKDNINDILSNQSPIEDKADHAIFYSVFRTNESTKIKNTGAVLIREAASWIKNNKKEIGHFVTMSPIPNLSAHFNEPPDIAVIAEFLREQKDPVARFHIRNGASLLRIIPNADVSDKRKTQSFCIMVNYDYTSNVITC